MEGFDTGFVTFARAWDQLRPSDLGNLWEHLVLDVLLAGIGPDRVRFWRDKLKREVDFVVVGERGRCHSIECKWSSDSWSPRSLAAFRGLHAKGINIVVSPQLEPPMIRTRGLFEVVFCNLNDLEVTLKEASPPPR